MWPFNKSKIVNKTIVTMQPPILGTFQEHLKVLVAFYPKVTKDEIALIKERWLDNSTVRFLTPLTVDQAEKIKRKQNDSSWEIYIRDLSQPSCDCSNYYASPCCGGLTLGVSSHPSTVMDLELPESLLSRGSFLTELTTNTMVPLTKSEVEYFSDAGCRVLQKHQVEEY